MPGAHTCVMPPMCRRGSEKIHALATVLSQVESLGEKPSKYEDEKCSPRASECAEGPQRLQRPRRRRRSAPSSNEFAAPRQGSPWGYRRGGGAHWKSPPELQRLAASSGRDRPSPGPLRSGSEERLRNVQLEAAHHQIAHLEHRSVCLGARSHRGMAPTHCLGHAEMRGVGRTFVLVVCVAIEE